jgi:hypothetical protein
MATFLKGPVQSVQPHALPFRAIFAEHLKRDEAGLLQNAKTSLAEEKREDGASEAEKEPKDMLLSCIAKQENAYKALDDANKDISEGRGVPDLLYRLDC